MKVYILVTREVWDSDDHGVELSAHPTKQQAIEALQEWRKSVIHDVSMCCEEKGSYEILVDEPDCFTAMDTEWPCCDTVTSYIKEFDL